MSVEAAGRRYQLVGFQTGHSLCLELVRPSKPEPKYPSCIPKRYLEQVDEGAVVVNRVSFGVNDPDVVVDGAFGFVADDVRSVVVEREGGGRSRAAVAENVFVSLASWPAGTAGRPGPAKPIKRIWAAGRRGRGLVPVVSGWGAVAGARDLGGPVYLAADPRRADQLPGPKAVQRRLANPRVGWLERGEARGDAVPLRRRPGAPTERPRRIARAIQPDPGDPFRVAVSFHRRRDTGAGTAVCLGELQPLRPARGAGFTSCVATGDSERRSAGAGAVALGAMYGPSQWTRVLGVAADGVAALELYLANGRNFPVPLRHNVFSVQAPFPEFPAKLVALDAERRVVDVMVLPGPMRPRLCPPAVFPRSVDELPPPRRFERIDLGARTIAGHKIFGRTVEEVVAALGPPARIHRNGYSWRKGRRWPQYEVRYGGGRALEAAVTIHFLERFGRVVAARIRFSSPSTVDVRLGHVLRMQPERLEREIERVYGDRWKLTSGYGARPAWHGCGGSFEARGQYRRSLSFGLSPYRPSRPHLSLHWP